MKTNAPNKAAAQKKAAAPKKATASIDERFKHFTSGKVNKTHETPAGIYYIDTFKDGTLLLDTSNVSKELLSTIKGLPK